MAQADKHVIGGSYCYKRYPLELSVQYLESSTHKKLISELNFKESIIEVQSLPTGFLMISKDAFQYLKDKVPVYKDSNGLIYEFFKTPIGKDERFTPEDWYFCNLCRDNGIAINFHTEVIVDHIGSATYGKQIANIQNLTR